MKNKFILCGIIGWGLEIFWTGLASLRRRELVLNGHSSLWMFPIYGCAALFAPLSRLLKGFPVLLRGLIYMIQIFLIEYVTGSFLKKRGLCPWDYTDSPFHIGGVIRLDYAPVWFFTGLLFEKLLKKK